MRKSIQAATLLALALVLSPLAMAGEGKSCCKAKGAKTTVAEKCDPKSCPPEKCDKHSAAACEKKTTDASKVKAEKPAVKPAA